jgi:hypothetical protein
MNHLEAVFWDYPQLKNETNLKRFIKKSKKSKKSYSWVLRRFLENARVVDTLEYFSLREIADILPEIRLSPYSRKKWKRIIEVYGKTKRK